MYSIFIYLPWGYYIWGLGGKVVPLFCCRRESIKNYVRCMYMCVMYCT